MLNQELKELIGALGLIMIGGFMFGQVLAFPMNWLKSRKGQLEPGFHTFDVISVVIMSVLGVSLTSVWYMATGNWAALLVFAVIMICAAVPLNVYLGKLRKPNDAIQPALEDESSKVRAKNTTNRKMPAHLAGHWKALFYGTVFPLFIALLVGNVLLMERYAPFLTDLFRAADGGDSEALIAFLISCPLPVAFSFVWYKLFSWLAKRDWIARQNSATARRLQAFSTRRLR